MNLRSITIMCFLVLGFSAGPLSVSAQTTTDGIANGSLWLLSARYGMAHWGLSAPPDPLATEFTTDDFSRTYFRDTLEAINALQTIGTASTEYDSSLNWLSRSTAQVTSHLSKKTNILAISGSDVTDDLSTLFSFQNSDSGFGGGLGFPSDIPDTAIALQAITVADSASTGVINGAVNYLIFTQNSDGGWGFIPGKQSEVYYTALAMQALLTQPQTTTIANALNKGTTFLLAHQNADGGFGSSPSTVWETAQVFLAISKTTGDAAVRTAAIDYLLTQQQADGSWNQDPYSTALALQALYAAQNQTGPPASPTTGTLTGTVTDGTTQAPLQNVLVEVPALALSTTTDASGAFTLSNVAAGGSRFRKDPGS